MKKEVIFLLTLVLCFFSATGQNFFNTDEAGFEFSVSPDLNPNASNPCEFCRPQTGRWRASHNSPQLWSPVFPSGPTPFQGGKIAFMQGGSLGRADYSEGIFIPYSFQPDRYYTLSFFVWRGSHMNVKLANGLVNNSNGEGIQSGNINFPSTSDTQTILQNFIVPGTGWELVEIKNLRPDKAYSQLWIHSSQVVDTDIFMDACMLFKSCCIPVAEYQDTTDPPSTMVSEYILAGDSIIPGKPVGPVNFTRPWKTVWQAGELDGSGVLQGRITLKKGFKSGQSFVARVRDCFTSPLDAFIYDSVIHMLNEQGNCLVQIRARICFGSGRYSISGVNLNTGTALPKGTWVSDTYILIVYPGEPTEYEITITDNTTGETIKRRIIIGKCGCIPPKDVAGVNKINTICGPSPGNDCFTIGKDLPPNTSFKWRAEPAGGMSYMVDTSKTPARVCFPPSMGGTGQFTYKLISYSPGCDSVTSEFHVFYKRVPDNNCIFYNGFWGPQSGINDSNKLTLGFEVSLDVEAVYIELYEDGNPVPVYTEDLIRGIDFISTTTDFTWNHYFFGDVSDGIPYTVIIRYKCRCSSTVNIGRIRGITF